jgi:hypothetical protein
MVNRTKYVGISSIKSVVFHLYLYNYCGDIPIKTSLLLFDKMILPILLYAAEIWGFSARRSIEQVQIKFYKCILGLPPQTSNVAVLGECGRYPISILYRTRCIKFWLKLVCGDATTHTKQVYIVLYSFCNVGRITWASEVKQLLYSVGFGHVWLAQSVGDVNMLLL